MGPATSTTLSVPETSPVPFENTFRSHGNQSDSGTVSPNHKRWRLSYGAGSVPSGIARIAEL